MVSLQSITMARMLHSPSSSPCTQQLTTTLTTAYCNKRNVSPTEQHPQRRDQYRP